MISKHALGAKTLPATNLAFLLLFIGQPQKTAAFPSDTHQDGASRSSLVHDKILPAQKGEDTFCIPPTCGPAIKFCLIPKSASKETSTAPLTTTKARLHAKLDSPSGRHQNGHIGWLRPALHRPEDGAGTRDRARQTHNPVGKTPPASYNHAFAMHWNWSHGSRTHQQHLQQARGSGAARRRASEVSLTTIRNANA